MPSEFDLIARYFARPVKNVVLGIGDDCALVRPPEGLGVAITTDMLCEGTHFFADVDPRSLGHKTLAVNLSDIAAMGADPRWATLAIALPRVNEEWLQGFTDGFFALAERFDVELIGGDTTKGPLTLSVTLLGTYPLGHALRRGYPVRPARRRWPFCSVGEGYPCRSTHWRSVAGIWTGPNRVCCWGAHCARLRRRRSMCRMAWSPTLAIFASGPGSMRRSHCSVCRDCLCSKPMASIPRSHGGRSWRAVTTMNSHSPRHRPRVKRSRHLLYACRFV